MLLQKGSFAQAAERVAALEAERQRMSGELAAAHNDRAELAQRLEHAGACATSPGCAPSFTLHAVAQVGVREPPADSHHI